MSYLSSWIILVGSVSVITAQGFYGGAGNGFGGGFGGGGGGGGNPQGSGQYGGPQAQMQQGAMPQGRSLGNPGNPQTPQQPPLQSGSGGLPVIFTNPQMAAADKGAAGVQTPPMTAQGQQPTPGNVPIAPGNPPVGSANTILTPGATLPAASAANPLYGGSVAVIGLYGNRPTDGSFGRSYGGYGNGLDDQWGQGGYGNDRYGMYGGGFDDYGGMGPYGRSLNEGYGSSGSGASRYDGGQWGGSGRGQSVFGGPGGGRGGGAGGGWNL